MFKKKTEQKFYFIFEKIDFEKIFLYFFEKYENFSNTNKRFSYCKLLIFLKIFENYFFKIDFLKNKKIFLLRIFFKPQMLDLNFPLKKTRRATDQYCNRYRFW